MNGGRRAAGPLAGALGGLLAVLVAGCADRPAPPTDPRAALQATITAAPRLPAVSATALVRVADAGQEPLTVTLYFWLDGAGRLRLRGTKATATFLDVLAEADGTVLAVDPRARAITRFRLGDPRLPSLLRFLPRLAEELRQGPLAAGGPVLTSATADHAEGHLADGVPVAYDLTPRGEPVAATIDALTIRYDDWQDYDGIRRPRRLRLTVEGTDVRAVLQDFDAPGTMPPERMRLEPPAGAPELPLDRFLDQLGR